MPERLECNCKCPADTQQWCEGLALHSCSPLLIAPSNTTEHVLGKVVCIRGGHEMWRYARAHADNLFSSETGAHFAKDAAELKYSFVAKRSQMTLRERNG